MSSAMNAMARLNESRSKSGSSDADRSNYAGCLAKFRSQGWSQSDVAEYSEAVRVLMAKDDAAVMRLFPAGAYATAADARSGALAFWRVFA